MVPHNRLRQGPEPGRVAPPKYPTGRSDSGMGRCMGEHISIVHRGELAIPVRHAGNAGDETVILLHGFPQTSATWSPYLAHLAAAGYHAVAPDLRGYAPSARPTTVDHYKLDHLVDDVVAVADDLGVERFHLVGHDWGGIIAWAFAAAHPDRLHSLTSVSMPHPRAIVSSLLRSSQLLRFWYVGFFQMPLLPERLLAARGGALLRQFLRQYGLPHPPTDAYVTAMLQPGALQAAMSYFRALRPRPFLAVGRISVPTLFVWSTHDAALGPVAAGATEAQIDGPYRFEVLPETNHWILETRFDQLIQLIEDHLLASGSPGGRSQRERSRGHPPH